MDREQQIFTSIKDLLIAARKLENDKANASDGYRSWIPKSGI